jgi:hypothetical protein
MKYTTLDANGLPTAFYSDDIHENIPVDAIQITDEQWQECINNQGTRQFIDGVLVTYVAPVTLAQAKDIKLAEVKVAYNTTVSALVGNTDEFELTSWSIQESEARAYVASNTAITPLLSGIIIARGLGETVEQFANLIIANADAYRVAYANILGTYQAKQKAINVALTVSEVQSI